MIFLSLLLLAFALEDCSGFHAKPVKNLFPVGNFSNAFLPIADLPVDPSPDDITSLSIDLRSGCGCTFDLGLDCCLCLR